VIIDARKLNDYHSLEAEHGRLVLLDDAEKGLKDALAGRVMSDESFRKTLRRMRTVRWRGSRNAGGAPLHRPVQVEM